MNFIASIVSATVAYFKADPRKAAHIVAAALGYLVIAASVIDGAIAVLKQVLIGLGAG